MKAKRNENENSISIINDGVMTVFYNTPDGGIEECGYVMDTQDQWVPSYSKNVKTVQIQMQKDTIKINHSL